MVHPLARNKLQVPCPCCFEILKPISSQRFVCDNPKCHLLEVTVNIVYSEEKRETVYQYKRKEWVEGEAKSDYVLLKRKQLSDHLTKKEKDLAIWKELSHWGKYDANMDEKLARICCARVRDEISFVKNLLEVSE